MDGYTEESFIEWILAEFIYVECPGDDSLVDSDMVTLDGEAGDLVGVSVGGLHLVQLQH